MSKQTLALRVLAATALLFLSLAKSAAAPPYVYIFSPTNNSVLLGPANVTVFVRALGNTNAIATVEAFVGTTSLGVLTNGPGVMVTNIEPVFPFSWSNMALGSYALKAIATDVSGLASTSSVVTVTIVSNYPPPKPSVAIYSPTNGSLFLAPANISIYARAVETSGTVATVQFFAGSASLGIVSNSSQVTVSNISSVPVFPLTWSNVMAGTYSLKAVATDVNGNSATSSVVGIGVVTNYPPPRPSVAIYSPTNGSKFTAPTNLTLYARAVETTGTVATVQFFAGSASLGIVSNSSQVIVSNISTAPVFPLLWPNVTAGTYALKAVATDTNGYSGTSSIVSITVLTNAGPPKVPFAIGFYYPTNGQSYTAPASIGLHAAVVDSNVVKTVQYYSGAALIATVSNTSNVLLTNTSSANPFFFAWTNVPAGNYSFTAVGTDSAGIMATSSPVNVSVVSPPPITNKPPVVRITSPANVAAVKSPVNLPIYAYAHDPDGVIANVEFLANSNSLGFGTPLPPGTNSSSTYYTNIFSLVWSNVPPGQYALTARAADNSNAVSISTPVNITVQPPIIPVSNRAPVISVSAIDPIAVSGTNCWVYPGITNGSTSWSNWPTGSTASITNCGPKNAVFSIYRSGDTNSAVTVYYSLSGSASNGVDYAAVPGSATVAPGQRQAFVTIVPINNRTAPTNLTVIIRLSPSTVMPPAYSVGSPASAAALINDVPAPAAHASVMLPAKAFHLSATGPDGAWFHIEVSTDMMNWTSLCTNQVVNGTIDFIDPDTASSPARFYRAVPEPASP